MMQKRPPVPPCTDLTRSVAHSGAFFISDLHLSDDMPATLAQFEHFCQHIAVTQPALFILGDLFEFWIGDDVSAKSAAAARVANSLKQLHQNGTTVYFLAGNRDFLLQADYCQQACMTALPDPCIISIDQKRILLTHGDLLCTDDADYQRYRRCVHKKWLQWLFLKTPASWRLKLATRLRIKSNSQKEQTNTPSQYTKQDVVESSAQDWFEQNGVSLIVHGHTHRPDTHQQPYGKRHVLPDWECERAEQIRWGYLLIEPSQTTPELNVIDEARSF